MMSTSEQKPLILWGAVTGPSSILLKFPGSASHVFGLHNVKDEASLLDSAFMNPNVQDNIPFIKNHGGFTGRVPYAEAPPVYLRLPSWRVPSFRRQYVVNEGRHPLYSLPMTNTGAPPSACSGSGRGSTRTRNLFPFQTGP